MRLVSGCEHYKNVLASVRYPADINAPFNTDTIGGTLRENLLSTYDYPLPAELVAKEPLPTRDASRLMVVDRRTGTITHRHFRELPDLLQPKDCLVLNNSRVLPARLFGTRTVTGGKWEGLYLGSTSTGRWRLIGQTRGYLRLHETITLINRDGESLQLKLMEKDVDGVCHFEPSRAANTLALLQQFGTVPLPPYMDRKQASANDWERYQTTYALHPGSVAAPTAGLHFTPEVLEACQRRGIGRAEVTLHVGIGTFRPVAVEQIADHRMHAEWCELSESTALALTTTRVNGGRIVAVGTTSLRTLESAQFHSGQLSHEFRAWHGETNLFIRPPSQIRSAEILLTNFHLPKSTLLMLVSAFGGLDLVLEAYHAAIAERYRFFSYGDAMLIL